MNTKTLTYYILINILFVNFSTLPNVTGKSNPRPKSVTVSLSANWRGSPLAAEAAEFLYRQDPKLFWNFVENFGTENSQNKEKNCWKNVHRSGSSELSENLSRLLAVSLALRHYSPKVEILRKFSDIKNTHQSCCWVEALNSREKDGNHIISTIEALKNYLSKNKKTLDASIELDEQIFYKYNIRDSSVKNPNKRIFTLHGGIGTECFRKFHGILKEAVGNNTDDIIYAFQPYLNKEVCYEKGEVIDECSLFGMVEKLSVPGFGIEISLKSTEYSASDEKQIFTLKDSENEILNTTGDIDKKLLGTTRGFDFDILINRYPELEQELLTFRDMLMLQEEISGNLKDLKVWDIRDLGIQTSHRILSASDPLNLLTEIIQNFPSFAPSLYQAVCDENLRNGIKANENLIPSSYKIELLNGVPINLAEMDIFEFLEKLTTEIKIYESLKSLGLSSSVISELMAVRADDKSNDLEKVRFDLFKEKDIFFLNNLEKDDRYSNFHTSIKALLNPLYLREGPYIKKNILTAVFILDFEDPEMPDLIKYILKFYDKNFPMRFGLIPKLKQKQFGDLKSSADWINMDNEQKLISLFFVIQKIFDIEQAFRFISKINKEDVEYQFIKFCDLLKNEGSKSNHHNILPKEILSKMKGGEKLYGEVISYLNSLENLSKEKGLFNLRGSNYIWLNGRFQEIKSNDLSQSMSNLIRQELPYIQYMIYYGTIPTNTDNLLGEIMKNSDTLESYDQNFLSANNLEIMVFDLNFDLEKLIFIETPTDNPETKSVSHLLFIDFFKENTIYTINSCLKFLKSKYGQKSRIAIISTNQNVDSNLLQDLWQISSNNFKKDKKAFFKLWFDILSSENDYSSLLFTNNTKVGNMASKDCTIPDILKFKILEYFSKLDINIKDSGNMPQNISLKNLLNSGIEINSGLLISNGQIYNIEFLSESALRTVQKVQEEFKISDAIRRILTKRLSPTISYERINHLIYMSNIIFDSNPVEIEETEVSAANFKKIIKRLSKETSFVTKGESEGLEIIAVLDPLRKDVQKISQILLFLHQVLNLKVTIYLNPKLDLHEMPIKQYYRYSLPQLTFSNDNFLIDVTPPLTHFSNLPKGRLLTVNPDVPYLWLVELAQSQYDLDNLRIEDLGDLEDTLFVEYHLENLILSGSCIDMGNAVTSRIHPRGLQLTLGDYFSQEVVDTIVMANLGYYQLKTNPGIWYLKLAEGRSMKIYEFLPNKKFSSFIYDDNEKIIGMKIYVDSFMGNSKILKMRKRERMENEDVLKNSKSMNIIQKSDSSFLKSVINWFGTAKTVNGREKENGNEIEVIWKCEHPEDPVNIFTIASGHMYERLQKIMILSVLKNTKSCVKFWFIKNYMSPQMKKFLPYFSKEYKFDYGLVTYKWPEWLHQQTEKQRVIWAYKILFLDVLFPLSVRKVIFLDSDQIIRTDMRTLYDMDINNAPLAYTPFCDNNKEMDGFRFWKGGFWKSHLMGKPYHISALYVVDLVRFREMAAGDQLRVIYDNLSKDPNSLSNLDQDLPNYAQHSVPIYSLPKEWLWCETWCGNETKEFAKTIDLCNNPLTKESKLQSAKRVVEEWPALDEEAKQFTKYVEKILESSDAEEDNEKSIFNNNDSDISFKQITSDKQQPHDWTEL